MVTVSRLELMRTKEHIIIILNSTFVKRHFDIKPTQCTSLFASI